MGKLMNSAELYKNVAIKHDHLVSHEDVIETQQKWATAIVDIGKVYIDEQGYRHAAELHLRDLYAFEYGDILFKPTLASNVPFRPRFDEALSYFVGGSVHEDKGFAIKPWAKVTFGEQQIILTMDGALAMGEYFFTPYDLSQGDTRVEFSFAYLIDEQGELKIRLHHSSLPYSP